MKMSSTPRMFKDAMQVRTLDTTPRHVNRLPSPTISLSSSYLNVVQAFRKMGTPSMAMPSFSWGNSPTTVPQLGSSTPHTSSDGISGQSGDGLGLSGTGAGGEGAGVAATPRQVLLEEDTTGESRNSNNRRWREAACLTGAVSSVRGIGPRSRWLCTIASSEGPLCPRLRACLCSDPERGPEWWAGAGAG